MPASGPLAIGLDLGTSGLKAVLLSADGQLLAEATAPLTVQRPQPLWSEQAPADWLAAVHSAMAALREQADPAHWQQVRALAAAGQMHGAVLLGAQGQVLRPAILWNDGRCQAECVELEAREPATRRITANRAMAGFTAPKLMWVARHEPELFAQVDKVLLPKDWLVWQLTGQYSSEMSDAAGTLWLDVAGRQWSPAMLAASGITTVLDSLCIGDLGGDGFRSDILRKALDAITSAQMSGANRIDHKLHYRCEVADARTPGLFEDLIDNPLLTLVSLMDHTPGGRQYRDLDHYRNSTRPYRTDPGGIDVDIDTHIERLQARQAEHSMPNWERIAKMTTDRGLPLASHDDATLDDIDLAVRSGVTISEFPTSEIAARGARSAGMLTAAGAPNIVRGGSHSGNVAAAHLAGTGVLDIVTSDYVPYSLLHAPFVLASNGVLPLAEAIGLVTGGPARAVHLNDRGRISPGLRADLVRVALRDGVPMVNSVYSAGRRVG